MSNRTYAGYEEDLLARTEREICRKLFDIETINCLRTGFTMSFWS